MTVARHSTEFSFRLMAVFLTSVASGLPLLLSSQTLQAWFTQAGVGLVSIGALSLVSLPYVLKFLWAPMMDKYALFSSDRRKGWLYLTQIFLVITLLLMSLLSPQKHVFVLSVLALCLAFFSASQDVVVDGYRVDILDAKERGLGASAQLLGYRLGMLLAGSLAIVIAAQYGWRVSYCCMACLLLALFAYTFFLPVSPVSKCRAEWGRFSLLLPYQAIFFRKNSVIIVAVVLMYKMSDNMVFNLNMVFLLRHMHFSLLEVGAISNVVSVIGMLLGGVVAGAAMYRLTLYRSLVIFGWLQLLSHLGYVWLALAGKSMSVMAVSFFLENFCGGMATVAFVAFLTSLCDKQFSASQYALWSVVMSLPRVVLGPVTAWLVSVIGWVDFYALSCLAGLPALYLIWYLKKADRKSGSGSVFGAASL